MATAGYGALADEEGGLGSGGVFGGLGGWELTDAIGLEAAVTQSRHERLGTLSWTGDPLVVSGRLVSRFGSPGNRTRLFIAGGLGYFHYTGVFTETVYPTLNAPVPVEHPWRITGLAMEAGAGLEIAPAPRLVLRPEVWFAMGVAESRPNPEPPFAMPRIAFSAGFRL
jgi:hypothetical protein